MKYPKTLHLPCSPGQTGDDAVIADVGIFFDKEIVVTEKLDGECTSLHSDKVHARSESSAHHESRSLIKMIHATVCANKIPAHLQIVGENVYAKHSILYDRVTSNAFFYPFAVIDKTRQVFLSWAETMAICLPLFNEMVPVLFHGRITNKNNSHWLYVENFPENNLGQIYLPDKSALGDEIEGYVVRVAHEFPVADFGKYVAKWVRANHVQTDVQWKRTWTPNRMVK